MGLTQTVAQLMLEKGRAQGSALSQIGQEIGQIPNQIEQAKQTAELQRQRDARKTLSEALDPANVPKLNQEGTDLYDVQGIGNYMASKGFGAEYLPAAQHLDAVNQSMQQFQQARVGLVQRTAQALLQGGGDQGLTLNALEHMKGNQVYSDDTLDKYIDIVKNNPDKIKPLLTLMAGPQKPTVLKQGEQGFGADNAPIPVMAVAPKPTVIPATPFGGGPAQVMQGDQVVATGSPSTPRAEPNKPLNQQLLEAIASGNTEAADNIKKTLKDAAAASKDPAQVQLANELAGLRKSEAQARLDELNKKNQPIDVTPDIQTTGANRKYIDLSTYSGAERDKAREAATTAGAVPVSKEQADALQNIDNARMNQGSIMTQIQGLLPKDPTGRVLAVPSVKLEKIFQTNDQVAAYNSWRTAAIQTMRATAGSKGLRINRAEIEQAIENDIPKLTDTVGVAQQKIGNINTMLENAEKSILVHDRSTDAATPSGTGGLVNPFRK